MVNTNKPVKFLKLQDNVPVKGALDPMHLHALQVLNA
jgi:hypothetical protein